MAGQANSSSSALQVVGVLHQLVQESILAGSRRELVFRMLNRSVSLCRYDRALFFVLGARRPKLEGVSGQSEINKTSERPAQWTRLCAAIPDREQSRILSGEDFPESLREDFNACSGGAKGMSVMWLPLTAWGRLAGGLWLERWGETPWSENELKLMRSLAFGYRGAWERLNPRRPFFDRIRRLAGKKRGPAMVLAVAALLLFFRLPLRVVAPCEVVPEDPFVVTAPLAGVVEEVDVKPGDPVEKGQVLFVYDNRAALEELKVAREQVDIIESSLDRARTEAFADPKARSEIGILEHRLEQEKARLRLAEYNASRLEVRAKTSGVAVVASPEKWRGRPVTVGERVLSIVNPEKTKVRILVPEDDNMHFNLERPAKVLLNVFPETSMPARITYVGNEVVSDPGGLSGVEAEAEWEKRDPRVKIGLKGSSVLYGNEVSLAYWLFRKPWAAVKSFLGW